MDVKGLVAKTAKDALQGWRQGVAMQRILRLRQACKQRWHWNWRNDGSSLYQYNIEITDTRTNRKCTIDPFIRNG